MYPSAPAPRPPAEATLAAAVSRLAQQGDGITVTAEGRLVLDQVARQFLDALPLAVVIQSPGTEILCLNPAAQQMFGYPPEEAIGRLALDIGVGVADRRLAEQLLVEIVAGRPWRGEFPVRSRHAGTRIADVTAVPVVLDGETTAVVVALFDVTDRRLVDESVALLDTLMTTAPVGLAFFDTELRYVRLNDALAEMNGLPVAAHVGKRVDQVLPELDSALDDVLRQVLRTNEPVRGIEVSGYTPARPDELRTWLTSWYPLRAAGGAPIGVGAVVLDVTERKHAEEERLRLLALERAARADAERAQARYRLIADATAQLAGTLDWKETLDNIARLLVPRFADIAVVDLVEENHLVRVVSVAADPAVQQTVGNPLSHTVPSLDSDHPVARSVRTRRPVRIDRLQRGYMDRLAADRPESDAIRALAGRACVVVPLQLRGRVLGGLTLFTASGDNQYTDADERLAVELAQAAAQALENAQLYRAERRIADTLQHSLLPQQLPDVPGAVFARRYVAADADAEVGGDFYDVVAPPGVPWTVIVGDVGGKGVPAASIMGQLRAGLRAYALEGHAPAQLVHGLDALFSAMGTADFTTVLVAAYDEDRRLLRWSNAGHPPPLLRRAAGSVSFLEADPGVALGLGQDIAPAEAEVPVSPGDVLVLYTDGLVERRGDDIDTGLQALADVVTAAPSDPEQLADAVLSRLRPRGIRSDDVALLVVAFR